MKKDRIKKNMKEFKAFISKGNIMDMAVGVIMGTAFGKIVSSVVNDLLMPLIGTIMGGLDFAELSITIRNEQIKYGAFIQNVIDFLIIAVCLFLIIKFMASLHHKKEEEKKEEPPKKSDEALLLEEIRDLLKNRGEIGHGEN